MTLLFPAGLAALAALLLPLLLHLARRTEQRPTDFAALRWLRQRRRPRHRPRFDERLLLAVRLLLLAAIALVLAQPVAIAGAGDNAVVAVLPGATVPPDGAGRRLWLAPGFPPIATPPPTGPLPIASLIRDLDARLPRATRLTILVPRIVDGADAERPRLSRPVAWRIGGEGRAPPRAAAAARPRLYGDPDAPGKRYIAAALHALPPAPDRGEAPLVWLGAGALPAPVARAVAAGGVALVAATATVPAAATGIVWRDATGRPLVDGRAMGRGRVLRFVRPLTPQAMPELLDPGFPARLAALFAAPPAPARAMAEAYAPLPGGRRPTPPAQPLWPWLAVMVAVLFLVERWLATRASRLRAR